MDDFCRNQRVPFPLSDGTRLPVRYATSRHPAHAQSRAKKRAILFAATAFAILFAFAIAATLLAYTGRSASFATVFCHLWLMGMAWNAVDLLLVDGLLICTLASPLFILPNTAHCAGRRGFRFHLIGFLKGCVAMSAISGVLAVLTFGLMHIMR